MAVQIFRMNDCDWYAAESLQDALACMAEELGFATTLEGIAEMREEFGVDDPQALSEEEMRQTPFLEEESGTQCNFRRALDVLISTGEKFPCSFATTEC
jgi:hypothetical protein